MKTLTELLEELKAEPEWIRNGVWVEAVRSKLLAMTVGDTTADTIVEHHNRTRKKLLACAGYIAEAESIFGRMRMEAENGFEPVIGQYAKWHKNLVDTFAAALEEK